MGPGPDDEPFDLRTLVQAIDDAETTVGMQIETGTEGRSGIETCDKGDTEPQHPEVQAEAIADMDGDGTPIEVIQTNTSGLNSRVREQNLDPSSSQSTNRNF